MDVERERERFPGLNRPPGGEPARAASRRRILDPARRWTLKACPRDIRDHVVTTLTEGRVDRDITLGIAQW